MKHELIIKGRRVKTIIEEKGKSLVMRFAYNKTLLTEVKKMKGSRWNPDDKSWSVTDCERNRIGIEYLKGNDVYTDYLKTLINHPTRRPEVFKHQQLMVNMALNNKRVMWAAEMGTGKTLAFIETVELSGVALTLYVGTKSALRSVRLEVEKWGANFQCYYTTYESLHNLLESNLVVPDLVFFDESSKIKNHNARRSESAMKLANLVREKDGYIITASGTPTPKDPSDIWHQIEVLAPGFIAEGDKRKFTRKLALMQYIENGMGSKYEEVVTWWDDENKCQECGKMQHGHGNSHAWRKSINQVARISTMLKGIMVVLFKKDCLELPDKEFVEFKMKPTKEMLKQYGIFRNTKETAIGLLIALRQLSDGFIMDEKIVGEKECELCLGTTRTTNLESQEEIDCYRCNATGMENIIESKPKFIGSPKFDALTELADEYADIGRMVVYGSFVASVDNIVAHMCDLGWNVLRVDGRGYHCFNPDGLEIDSEELFLKEMDRSKNTGKIQKLCFVGNPKAASMGLTLHASPIAIYFSNDFSGEARMQSTDRIHRAGMDENRNAKIMDFICLKSDKLILNNLNNKKEMQDVVLGDIQKCMETSDD